MKGNKIKLIQWLAPQDENKIFIIKEYKEKRNLNQNSKYWVLVNQIALKLKISVEEVHKQMLRDYSVRYQILVPADKELRGIEYYDKKSRIIQGEQEFIVYYVYTPSHELDKEEFANLLNGVVQECQNLGIEVEI